MNIPLMDLVAQYRSLQTEIDSAVREVIEKGSFVLGPTVTALEHEVAAYLGTSHAVGLASGTDALVLTMRAMDIGPGDEVIVPVYTFYATAEAVAMVGATPVFVDVQPDTYCIDPIQVAGRINKHTKAIIPVHLYGHPADMDPIIQLAHAKGIKVIEDNAQSFGSAYNDTKTGSLADAGCISFFPSKNLGGFGDGGMVVTNDPELDDRIRMLRSHGWKKKYCPEVIGYNSRLDALQAAILRAKLPHIDQWNDARRELAQRYNQSLLELGIVVPHEAPYGRHVYHLFMIQTPHRDHLATSLKDQGVASAVYYPQPLHLMKPFASHGHKSGKFPVAEKASGNLLAIPMFPEMSHDQLDYVVASLKQAIVSAPGANS